MEIQAIKEEYEQKMEKEEEKRKLNHQQVNIEHVMDQLKTNFLNG